MSYSLSDGGGLDNRRGNFQNRGKSMIKTKANFEASETLTSNEMAPPTTAAAKAYDLWFGTLFLMIHGNKQHPILDYVAIVLEDLQMISWAFSIKLGIHSLPNFIVALLNIFEYRGPSITAQATSIIFALSATAIGMLLVLLCYVATAYSNGIFSFGWSLYILRTLAFFIPTCLFVPLLNSFLVSVGPLEIIFSVLTILLGLILNFMFYESNPTETRPLRKLHGRFELIYCVIKTIVVLTWKYWMLKSYTLDGVLTTAGVTIMTGILCLSLLYYYPYYDEKINHIRFGFFFAAFWVNFISFVNTAFYYWNPTQAKSVGIMISLLVLLVPFWLIGFKLSKWYYNYVTLKIDRLLVLKTSDRVDRREKSLTWAFSRWTLIEVSARSILKDFSSRVRYFNFKQEWPVFTRKFEQGMLEFPNEKFVPVALGLYLDELVDSEFEGSLTEQLERKQAVQSLLYKTAKIFLKFRERKPAWDIDFLIYYIERSLAQKRAVHELGEDLKMDVAEFADFKKNERLASFSHDTGFRTLLKCWKLVLTKDYDKTILAKYAETLYKSIADGNEAYAALIKKFPKSHNILRKYAKFLIEIGNEPYKATVLLRRAEILESETLEKTVNDGRALLGKEASFLKELQNPDVTSYEQNTNISSKIKEAANIGAIPFAIDENMEANFLEDHDGNNQERQTVLAKRESSSVHTENSRELKRELENKAARSAITKHSNQILKRLTFQNIFSLLLTTCLLIANFVVVVQIISESEKAIVYEQFVFERDYNTSELLFSSRKLYEAKETKDAKLFEFYRKRVMDKVDGIQKNGRDVLFAERNTKSKILEAMWTTPTFNATFSFLPETEEREVKKISLYSYTDLYIVNALAVAAIEIDTAASLADNNHFRFIADNFMGVQVSFEQSRKVFVHEIEVEEENSRTTIVIFTVIQIVSLLIVLFLLDLNLNKTIERQTKSLGIFRYIPHHSIKQVIKDLESADADEFGSAGDIRGNGEGQDETLIEGEGKLSLKGIWMFRIRYMVYFLILAASFISFAFVNSTVIEDIAEHITYMSEFGETLTYGMRAFTMANEIKVSDYETWVSDENMARQYSKTYEKLHDAHGNVLYGDKTLMPPGKSIDHLSEHILKIWYASEESKCLLLNQTLCKNTDRTMNITNFPSSFFEMGLEAVTRKVVFELSSIDLSVKNNELEIQPNILESIWPLVMHEYPDGYRKCLTKLKEEVLTIIESSNSFNTALFVSTMIFLIFSYMIVFHYIISKLKFHNNEIAELILYIPSEISKNVPEISHFILSGEITEANESDLKVHERKHKQSKKNQILPAQP